ncbi:MAG: PorV/PorQ family protein [Candidatus Latescibacteria bacterium]|nr:PorV/PorQ family protein [Candidatus Latescibacterota bacterium]
MLRSLIGFIGLSLCLCNSSQAASGYAGEFLALGTGARALALGSAYVALADDASAGYWNAAGLASLGQRQAQVMHAERFSGLVQNDYLALALPAQWIDGLAFSLIRVGVNDIEFTALQDPDRPLGPNNRPLVASRANSADYALYLSGGHNITQRLAVGTSAKLIYRTVGDFSAYGLGLDLGLRYSLSHAFTLAANLRDLTTTPIIWDTDTTDRIQPSLLIGLAYTRPLGSGQASISFASRTGGDATDQGDNAPLNLGVEYQYQYIALRAGFEEDRQAFGLGLRPHKRLSLDLGYLQHDALEATYRLSAGFDF